MVRTVFYLLNLTFERSDSLALVRLDRPFPALCSMGLGGRPGPEHLSEAEKTRQQPSLAWLEPGKWRRGIPWAEQ